MGAALALAGIAACDAKHTQHDQNTVGPPVNVIGSNLDSANPQIPADGFIQLAFDRYLLPDTITRQSWAILDANHAPLPTLGLKTVYDPVARTVTLSGPDGPGKPWLTENLTYHLVLPVPPDPSNDMSGFRAIDRAPLAGPRDYTFRAVAATQQTVIEPKVDFCADVLPIFYKNCSGPPCHQGDQSAESLVLVTADGVRFTARSRVSQGANTGARAGSSSPPGPIFGIDMSIIEPGDPGSSWLMYKLELEAPSPPPTPPTPPPLLKDGGDGGPAILEVTTCSQPTGVKTVSSVSTPIVPVAPFRNADEAEREALRNKVIGNVMPYPSNAPPLTFQERELIRTWIAQGAQIVECLGCQTDDVPLIDAGPPAVRSDAGDAGDAGDGGDASDASDSG